MSLRLAMLVLVLSLMTVMQGAIATEPAANAEAVALIAQLGLKEAPTPVRQRPDWAPLRKVAVFVPGSSWAPRRDVLLAQVRAVAGDAEVVAFDGQSLHVLADADAVLGICSPDVLAAAPKLRWLHSYSVGVERCTRFDGIDRYDFVLTNNQRLSGPDIAEHAIALTLALSRNLGTYMRAQQQGRWEDGPPSMNVDGRTMLVLGLGGIGTEIARRADALGMHVIATRNSSREGPDFVDQVGLPDEASTLAAQADVIVNALPLTDETAGSIGRAFFAAAKPGARYISVGRGGTTVTADLVAALQSGQIGGAGLDVTDPEPLPAGHPLWTMDNVLITPHVAALTEEVPDRTLVIAVENLRRYVQGEPMLSVVDFERGY